MLRLKGIHSILHEFACEMALMDRARGASVSQPTLVRAALWEPTSTAVVLGRNSSLKHEIHTRTVYDDGVAVLRRTSGGSPVVVAPGMLCLGLVMVDPERPPLEWRAWFRRLLTAVGEVLRSLGRPVTFQPPGDLALGDRKVVGSAARCSQGAMLFHASILCRAPLELVARYLPRPKREPAYRRGRDHLDFLTNLDLDPNHVAEALAETFEPGFEWDDWDVDEVQRLARHYASPTWLALGRPLRPGPCRLVDSAFAVPRETGLR